ncbi:hypothetical protein K1T71_006460 [Dendrolimus kikuchii]|uniref:Uncharacterized protein n=1 Tax=Dendrolimus kikuchii TaxID=765133 RepID=A0ACC1D167_9NEOP|nr:hypothetical protein K1T71_006460 [Dendrolimus kikuchii]
MVLENSKSDIVVNEACHSYDDAVELTGHGCYNHLVLLTCCIITLAFAMDMFGYSVVVAGSSCDLNLGLTEIGVLASAPFAGVVLAFPLGYYADTRGRKRALLICTALGFIFAALTSIATSWQFMLALKIIGSSFSSACMMLTMTYLGECTGVKHRGSYLFIMNSTNFASELVTFGLAYLILPLDFNTPIPWLAITYRPWRLYTFACALPLGIGMIMMLFLHESPKFIANKGDEAKALDVLKSIYKRNGGNMEEYPVKSIILTDRTHCQKISFCESVVRQTVPIFKPPLLWRTIQLFYLLAICCAANNVVIMWYPTIVNFFFTSISNGLSSDKTFCEKVFGNMTLETGDVEYVCNDTISTNTIYAGMLNGLIFFILGLVASKGASHRRAVLITILLVSGICGTLVELKNPIANMIFYTLMQSTCIGIGSVASYFVDMYHTSYRGLVTSLGIMVARICSFAGINITGALITQNCTLTFYSWSAFVLSGVVVSLFLPSDKKLNKVTS